MPVLHQGGLEYKDTSNRVTGNREGVGTSQNRASLCLFLDLSLGLDGVSCLILREFVMVGSCLAGNL